MRSRVGETHPHQRRPGTAPHSIGQTGRRQNIGGIEGSPHRESGNLPGSTTSALVYLEAGHYALIDVIPNAEGVLHFQMGLLKGLTITEHTGMMPGEPKPDVTVILTDFNFGMEESPVAGEQMIRLRNAGSQVHEVFLVKLKKGKTAEDYLNTPPGEIPPAVSLAGITGIPSGDSQYIRLNL
jgi:hypothetical protein